MAAYKCYLTRGQHVPAFQTIECDHDSEAIARATALLDAEPEHWGIEIWKDARLLARVSKARPQAQQGARSRRA
jgi:hypothetical protein